MKYNVAIFLTIVLCLFRQNAYPNLNKKDSLQAVLHDVNTDDSIEIITELGRIALHETDYQQALESFYKALTISERVNNKINISKLTNNIAAVYYHIDSLDRALKYFKESYEIDQTLGNHQGMAMSLNNIAIIYNEQERFSEALDYYTKALEVKKKVNDKKGIGVTYNNMGLVYIKKKDYNQAIEYFNRSLEIFNGLELQWSIANSYSNLSRAYYFMEKYDIALQYIDKSQIIARQVDGKRLIKDNLMTLANIYAETGDYKKAFEYSNQYHDLKDSLKSLSVSENLNEIRTRYETQRKEKENVILKKEKETQQATIRMQMYLGIAGLIVLILLVVLAIHMYRNGKIKARAYDELESQNKEIEKQREELDALNQIKNKIFSIISHEVRSPLNSLLGTVSLLNSGVLSPEEFFKLSADLKSKVSHTTNFLNNLLVWAKSQMQGMHVEPGTFDLNDLVNETVDLLKEQADMKGVEITFEKSENILANADRNMVSIVLKNLITNAIKFTSKGQKICLKTIKNSRHAMISVKDEGVGMSDEVQEKLFSLDSISTKGTAQEVGTGLGLMLSKSLVEENGGKIWVETEAGKGSIFNFTIPLN